MSMLFFSYCANKGGNSISQKVVCCPLSQNFLMPQKYTEDIQSTVLFCDATKFIIYADPLIGYLIG
jgi:hypothetical protein